MKKLFVFIVFLLFFNAVYSTPQAGDRLIYNGDTISIYPFILEQYICNSPDKETINKKIEKYARVSTGCWRGFQALLEIRNDSLFLKKAYGLEELDLSLIFDKKDSIFVGWYTGILTCPKNMLIYEHSGWGGYYEYETDFRFENGLLKDIQEYHNYIKPTIYTNQDTLMNFIKSNIDYNKVELVGRKIRVYTRIDGVDKNGKITEVFILRGHEGYNEEAVRVIKSIPQWQVIIRRGKQVHIPWAIPVTFEEKD